MTEFELGITCDMHVHVRDSSMCELVTPTIREGGISVAYIMPNLQPPITTLSRVIEYKNKLEKLSPQTSFLMTFYLSKELTPELIHEAAKAKAIHGVKCYPAGVTTNSSSGVDPNDFTPYYDIFQAMQEEGIVLNLHGEKPNRNIDGEDIHVLNAEESFLPALKKIHEAFPKLKIVLEHCTTRAAVDAVLEINKGIEHAKDVRVAATITAHHLSLTVDDWAGNPINFCKPVAKLPSDRRALVEAAISGAPYFFFGSDSAPHPLQNKAKHVGVCAGVFSQSLAIPYLAEVFEANNALDKLRAFVSEYPLQFYNINKDLLKCQDKAVIYKKRQQVPETITDGKDIVIAPFKSGEFLNWSVKWIQ
ncbi:HCL246Cp [Eremothecium sinecaudum]|uniref:dihydroorotase n=1 Tax=Eremothecium sinecaudum TaxID=45286 RepID=A0A109UYI4_9SACH|nr:HCL246Cp [Eremothecium sinecaudum]AMD19905.1 HCL246Cp [Eremothecium sinecaudum]